MARRRELGDAEDALLRCLDDPVPRVRAAAARALGRIGDLEAEAGLRSLLNDGDRAVCLAARAALRELSSRLGH